MAMVKFHEDELMELYSLLLKSLQVRDREAAINPASIQNLLANSGTSSTEIFMESQH